VTRTRNDVKDAASIDAAEFVCNHRFSIITIAGSLAGGVSACRRITQTISGAQRA
jgi:hypothetical protein